MKKFLASLLIFVMTAGNVLAAVGTDVSDGFWAEKEIAACVNDGIISLYDDGSFQPEKEVKRADFNSMLLRALGHALESSTVEKIHQENMPKVILSESQVNLAIILYLKMVKKKWSVRSYNV